MRRREYIDVIETALEHCEEWRHLQGGGEKEERIKKEMVRGKGGEKKGKN